MDNPATVKNHGWTVTMAAIGINLALGILYSWSVISKAIPADWGWTEAQKSLPYAVACLVFSLMMVPAGRLQDKIGPRVVASIGGVLVGLGMILASTSTGLVMFILGFGVLAGTGIGFGYASATPPAVKWFPKEKVGLIAGLVVSGFGLASVYIAPLTEYLTKPDVLGVSKTMLVLGGAFLVVVTLLAQLLKAPPAGYNPNAKAAAGSAAAAPADDYSPMEVLRTPQFYLLWFMYACGAGAGLMVIGKLAAIAKTQANLNLGFLLVAALAVGNGAGRIVAGMVSDRIGRKNTLLIVFLIQAVMIFLLSRAGAGTALAQPVVLCVLSALIGANYGANLAIFPSVTKDFYGLKNFGVNYGLVFTAWGCGGFVLAFAAGKAYDVYKTFAIAYYGSIVLLILAAALTFLLKTPKHRGLAAK
jgi:OFA family oxalate/formate antiporter-like MFS transporter